jgi:lipid-binding SYLF domain-containing protein
MREMKVLITGVLVALFVTMAPLMINGAQAATEEMNEAQAVVDKARLTFEEFMRDQNFSWLHENLKNARGLVIFPQVIKAGYFVGGSGGTGVLVVRREDSCDWTAPAFYTIGSVTFGLQIGGEVSEVIMMAMTRKAIDSLLASSFKLGGDTSVALGPMGAGAKANITADFISFAKTKGLYAGINLEGSVVAVRDGLNSEYYSRGVRPADIVVKRDVDNRGSQEFRATLRRQLISHEASCPA